MRCALHYTFWTQTLVDSIQTQEECESVHFTMTSRTAQARVSSINLAMEEKVVLNIGGQHFVTFRSTLKNIPNSRLSQIDETDPSYDAALGRYLIMGPIIGQLLRLLNVWIIFIPYSG